MQFVSVRDFRSQSALIWKRLARAGEIVITSSGKPVAILSVTSENTFSQSLSVLRRAKALEALEMIQRSSKRKGLDQVSLDEVNQEIRHARKSKAA